MVKSKIYFFIILFVLAVEVIFVLFKIINRPEEAIHKTSDLKEKRNLPKTEYAVAVEEKIKEGGMLKKIFSQPVIEKRETSAEQKEDFKKEQTEQPIKEEVKKENLFGYEGWFLLKGKLYAMIKDMETDTTYFVSESEMIDEFKIVTVTAQETVLLSEEGESVTLKLSSDEKSVCEDKAEDDEEESVGLTEQKKYEE